MSNNYGLDLDSAWKRILAEVWTDDVPDILRWQDHKILWPTWKSELEAALNTGSYKPSPPTVVEMSKNAFLTRPLAVLAPKDRVVYEAVVDQLVPFIERALRPEVLSARVHVGSAGKPWMEDQVQAWLRFQDQCREIHESEGCEFMLSTDISGYYEYVDLQSLDDQLGNLASSSLSPQVALLMGILRAIENSSRVWGLPQGPTASGILANLPLISVDLALAQRPVQYRRWADDFNIFAHSRAELRRALQEMERLLRNQRLTISLQKTHIYQGKEIDRKFDNSRMDAIKYGLNISDPTVDKDLRSLFDDAVVGEPPDERAIRFAVSRLRKMNDPHAVQWILAHLHEVPYLASYLVGYLSQFAESFPEIEERIVEFLDDQERNIHAWMEMHLIRTVARLPRISSATRGHVWKVLKDGGKDSLVRQQAARCVGVHAIPGEAALLRNVFTSSADPALRRALLVAVVEAEPESTGHKSWVGTIADVDPGLASTCHFLLARASIPYP